MAKSSRKLRSLQCQPLHPRTPNRAGRPLGEYTFCRPILRVVLVRFRGPVPEARPLGMYHVHLRVIWFLAGCSALLERTCRIPEACSSAVVSLLRNPSGLSAHYRFSFFHNTGAVAGVFSVVGIIALVLIFVLLTSFIRRRRARKFDREIDEAAAAAAAAQIPDFDDFDYTSGTGVGYAQYSETSHGTYNQPPLSHERSRNNLADIPTSFDTHNNTGSPGAAGIGARGRSLRGGMQDPFGALANPPEQYEMTESRRSWHQGTLRGGGGPEVTTYDMLQAAGMSGSDPYAVTRAPSTRLANIPMQSGVSGLTRSQSQGTSTLPTNAENYPMPTAAPAYPGGQDRPYPPEKARYSGLYRPPGDADVYGGYQDRPSASLDNPHSAGLPPPRSQDEHEDMDEPSPYREEPARASLADDEDYGYSIGNRVLRVRCSFIIPLIDVIG